MSPLRLTGSTSGYSQIDAPAVAGDQLFTLPGTGGTLDRLNRAGNILQVVNGSTNVQANSTTSTYADTGLSATITPTSASSKVLVIVNQAGVGKSADNTWVTLKLFRGATDLGMFASAAYTNTALDQRIGSCCFVTLDSPASTSSITYKTQFARGAAVGTVYVNEGGNPAPNVSTLTLIEVAS